MSDEDYGSFDEEEAVEAAALAAVTPARLRLQQKTLFGGLAQVQVSPGAASYSATRNRQRNRNEPATHHRLDAEAIKTWIFPTNYAQRDYQYNMIRKALFTNVLVALPTGLGKTFIAAVVMYNWYRWAPDSKIIFLAPAKPLVTQQIDACYNVCGIPAGQTAELTGGVTLPRRTAAYQERRVFFLTPQTFQNDLKNGLIKAKDVSCLVVDEAHHATGNYAYVNVVRMLRAESDSFRVLALTATPGKTVETVQEVVDGLNISQIEIRNETSIDIRSYTHTKEENIIVIDLPSEMTAILDKYASLLKDMVQKLLSFGVGMTSDPTKLSAFGVREAVSKLQRESRGGRAGGNANAAFSVGGILASLAYNMELLQVHGIRPFYDAMIEIKNGVKSSENKKRIIKSPVFAAMMQDMKDLIQDPQYYGHPKLDRMCGLILNHFQKADEEGNTETRVMVFTSLRVSAESIVTVLKQHAPLVKVTPFFGQQASKTGDGMSQKVQQETIRNFKKGIYNVIVATSVGEEGLDIGEVDMIICYDSSSSPSRMLQRIGRTGRKRDGQVFVLCCRGKEETAFVKAKDAHKTMQSKIEKGIDIKLAEDVHRIIPWNINPECVKRELKVPVGDKITDRELTSAVRRKRQAKVFNMPDGVDTGFVSAGKLAGTKRKRATSKTQDINAVLWDFAAPGGNGLLTSAQERELDVRFRKLDEDAEGCLRLKREEEGRFLSRQEIRSISRPILVAHGQTIKTVKDLLHRRFTTNALTAQVEAHQEMIDSCEDLVPAPSYEQPKKSRAQTRPEVLVSASEDEREVGEDLNSQDDEFMSDIGSYAELGSFVNDEPTGSSDESDSIPATMPSIVRVSKQSAPARRLTNAADPLHIFSESENEQSDDDLDAPLPNNLEYQIDDDNDDARFDDDDNDENLPVAKKVRLSQLARDSDEDELPDTYTAMQKATTASAKLKTKSRTNKSTLNVKKKSMTKDHSRQPGIARSRIRIIDEDDDE